MSLAVATRTTGDLVTASIYNADLVGSINGLDATTSTITTTGTQTALGIPTGFGDLVIFANNATALTLQGITAGSDGQQLTIISIGAGAVDINHQNGSATAANRIITPGSTTRTLIAGAGRATLVYDVTTARWRVVSDDYAEFSWTPVLGGSGGTSGQTYAQQVGSGTKKGREVTLHFYIQMTTLGTLTTSAQIQGFPYTTRNTSNLRIPANIGYWTNFTNNFGQVGGYALPNGTTIELYGVPTGAPTGMAALVQADLANTTIIAGTIVYTAAV